MQTRRDQLQAYRFQNRRALAALVTGEPNVVEPPMRRLTVTTISGIMIAILVAVGFALVGLISPSAGSDWKKPGVIIVERGTYSRYVYLDKVLHPVLNYASAVLAVGSNQQPPTVMVDASELKDATRGATIGIDRAPDELPAASNLVSSPFSVCSRLQQGPANQLAARVSVEVGDTSGAQRLPPGSSVLVRGITNGQSYVLYGGQRLQVDGGDVATLLGLDNAPSLAVGTAFLDGVPAGPPLAPPRRIQGVGTPYRTAIDGQPARIGQLLHVRDGNRYYLILQDGLAPLSTLESQLLQALQVTGGKPIAPLEVGENTALALPKSTQADALQQNEFKGLPLRLPAPTTSAATGTGGHGGICAAYRTGSATPAFAVPPSTLPAYSTDIVRETARSRLGSADTVDITPGGAALVRDGDGSPTIFLIADPGLKFPVASADVLAGFGYGGARPASLAPQLLSLIPKGPALDPAAARRPVGG